MTARFDRLRAAADDWDAEEARLFRDSLLQIGSPSEGAESIALALGTAYPALRPDILRNVGYLESLAREGWSVARTRAQMQRRLLASCQVAEPPASLAGAPERPLDASQVRPGLRRGTAMERLRIALRELDPEIEIDVTAHEWSILAEAQLDIALREARQYVERRFGPIVGPDGQRNGFCVLGLGKLGGEELNAGSDVDITFVHESDEGWASPGGPHHPDALRPFDAFTRVAQRTVSTIDAHLDEGFCARVDLRLRPEGGSGPLTNSIGSMVTYYETFGRNWERGALLRARPVAGDLWVGTRVLEELVPFVFRRLVDPSIASDMMEMVRRSRAERSVVPARDLKLGSGGIREAEFFVQALQLIWGGQDPAVRSTNTLEGLRRLRMRGYVTERELRQVRDAYLLLRRTEHRIQLSTGLQTHLIPSVPTDRDRLARTLAYPSGVELTTALDRARTRVAARLASLASPAEENTDQTVDRVLNDLDGVALALDSSEPAFDTPDRSPRPRVPLAGIPVRTSVLMVPGLPASDVESSADPAQSFRQAIHALARRPLGPLGGVTRERHPGFARRLVRRILDAADPELAASLVSAFFDRLSDPGVDAYVRTFEGDDRALSRFVGLCGASAYLGGLLVGQPELADMLLFSHAAVEPSPQLFLEAELSDGMRIARDSVPGEGDATEAFVGALRRAKAGLEVVVGIRDLAGELGPREVGRLLSDMADQTLERTTDYVLGELGRHLGLDRPLGGLAVLAMGKLGGREIGYGSDLDVVFVYDAAALAGTDADPLDAPELYGRAAQRIVRLLSTVHDAGRGYELDVRLRPSGEQGLLVVSVEAFRSYHLDREVLGVHAAEWERQALVRLRPCAGDTRLGHVIAGIAAAAAYAGPPPRDELLRLRERMEKELAHERDGRYNLKYGRGGLADVELATQYLQMKHGSDPSLHTTETLAALEALEAAGHIAPPRAAVLRDGYRFLRRLEQRMRIVHGDRSALLEEGAPGVRTIARSVGFRDDPAGRAEALLTARYHTVADDIRAAFLDIFELPPRQK